MEPVGEHALIACTLGNTTFDGLGADVSAATGHQEQSHKQCQEELLHSVVLLARPASAHQSSRAMGTSPSESEGCTAQCGPPGMTCPGGPRDRSRAGRGSRSA